MKKFFTPNNVIFSLSLLILIWATANFFFWQKNEIPQTPASIIEELKKNSLSPILLSSQLLDNMVLGHPELNIYPAGGETYLNAGSPTDFILLEAFQSMDCDNLNEKLKTEKLLYSDGFTVKKCSLGNSDISIINASSFIDKFKVTVPPSEKEKKFMKGRYKTGSKEWQAMEAGLGEFGELKKLAISAHPLSDKKTIRVEISSIDKDNTKAFIGFGIANSGKKNGSKPVKLTAIQGEKTFSVLTKDGVWIEKEIPEFRYDEPLTLEIWTEDSGKRHFFFDIRYETKK